VDADEGRRARFEQINRSGSQIVRDAAALLDEEMALGIVAARNMQERMDKERRIDKADFREALQRLQGDAHQVLDLVSGQLSEARAAENSELISRFTRNMHDLLDVVVGVVSTSAEIAGQLAEANLPKPPAKKAGRTGPRAPATARTEANTAGAARVRES
jgi:signal transduction histidine kinase